MILNHREKQSFVTAKLQQKKASSKSFYQKMWKMLIKNTVSIKSMKRHT